MIEHVSLSRGTKYFVATHHIDKRIREVKRPRAWRIYHAIRTLCIGGWFAWVGMITLIGPLIALILGNGDITVKCSASYISVVLVIGLPIVAVLCDKAIRDMIKEGAEWECPDTFEELTCG